MTRSDNSWTQAFFLAATPSNDLLERSGSNLLTHWQHQDFLPTAWPDNSFGKAEDRVPAPVSKGAFLLVVDKAS